MKKVYPNLEKGGIEKFYDKFSAEEKKSFEEYFTYRTARGLSDISSPRRQILQTRYILDHPFKDITLLELRKIISIINKAELSNHYKNNVKVNLKNALKYFNPDWSMKLQNLEDIKTNGVSKHNEERINHKTLFSKEDIDKLAKAELNVKWRAFLLIQYEGGMRTKEVRELKWSDIKEVEEGLTEVNIFATKTKKARTIYLKEATHYLNLWKTEQENNNDKGTYIFHMRADKERPIAKFSVNEWFRKLCKKALGREGWNYLLRHSRATELYKLAKQGKISKDTAISFMGHSEDMSETYTHIDGTDVKVMLKEQVYNIEELPEEKKSELLLKQDLMEQRIKALELIIRKGMEAKLVSTEEEIPKDFDRDKTIEENNKLLKILNTI